MLKKILIFISLFFSLSACAKPSIEKVDETADLSQVVGLDVRTDRELVAHPAPGSVQVKMADLKNQVETKLPDKDAVIYVFCEAGFRARRAKKYMESIGYKNVKNIGSWREWNALKK